jgi:hypothetical protein
LTLDSVSGQYGGLGDETQANMAHVLMCIYLPCMR